MKREFDQAKNEYRSGVVQKIKENEEFRKHGLIQKISTNTKLANEYRSRVEMDSKNKLEFDRL